MDRSLFRIARSSVLLTLFAAAAFSYVFAQKAKAVYPDGRVELEDGKQVYLAGVQLFPESMPLLSTVLAAGDFEVKTEDKIPTQNGLESVYISCDLKLVQRAAGLPFETGKERVILNEFLVALGAAKVREDLDFSKKEDFLKVQEAARLKGEGVWSYENIP